MCKWSKADTARPGRLKLIRLRFKAEVTGCRVVLTPFIPKNYGFFFCLFVQNTEQRKCKSFLWYTNSISKNQGFLDTTVWSVSDMLSTVSVCVCVCTAVVGSYWRVPPPPPCIVRAGCRTSILFFLAPTRMCRHSTKYQRLPLLKAGIECPVKSVFYLLDIYWF